MTEIGPVDCAVIRFPGNRFRGDIAPALVDLVEAGTIRLIDAAFVSKDEDGEIVTFEVSELAPDVQERLGALDLEPRGLLSDEELQAIGEALEPSCSAALLVWENLWAGKVAQAMREAGGELMAFERVPHDMVEAARQWALSEA